MPHRAEATGKRRAGAPIDLADLDLHRDRVRCPRCRRWVSRLLAPVWGGLLCDRCFAEATGDRRDSPGTP
jgi:hypothetical protein